MLQQRDYLQSIVDTVRDPILVLNKDFLVISANRSFYRVFNTSPKETEDVFLYDIGSGQWDIASLRAQLQDILAYGHELDGFEVTTNFPGIGTKTMLLNARKLWRPGNHLEMILLSFEDVTVRRAAEQSMQEAHEDLLESYQQISEAYERERKIARALQLPLTLALVEDSFPGVSVASRYEASSAEAEIGGDFFDAFSISGGYLMCAVGDASGKGLAAAARAIQVKDVLRAYAREYPHSVSHVAARLNDYVCSNQFDGDNFSDLFVALVMVMIDPRTGQCIALSAGAEPPFVLRANGAIETVAVSGLPLGVVAQTLYLTVAFRLEKGDTVILLTDGVTESRSPTREFLGHEGMFDLLKAMGGNASLSDMADALLDGAKQFAEGNLRDDVCLLLVRQN